jgi:hypothetical protein
MALALLTTAAAGCGSPRRPPTSQNTTVACNSTEQCQAAIAAAAHQDVLVPHDSAIQFLSGGLPAPGVDLGGTLGYIEYRDASSGLTFEFHVSVRDPVMGTVDPTQCGAVPGAITPGGRRVCYSDQAIHFNLVFVKYVYAGIIYGLSSQDNRPPSDAVANQDKMWALGLVDTFR